MIIPQPGPQEQFISCSCDIAITGGGNYGGKTFSLLIDPLYHVGNPKFEAVFFRRSIPQVTNPGGLWDDARSIYRTLGVEFRTSPRHEAVFPSGARVTFTHMQHSDDRYSWDGAQIAGIYFDQLEQFDEEQFWYMLSRNRSVSGVKPYIRASYNPRPNHWLSRLIQWYWNPETGYPITERSGVARWFVRLNDEIHWGDSEQELMDRFPDESGLQPLSFTVIFSNAYDNKIGLEVDQSVIANLKALPFVEQERRLRGNHKIEDYTGDGLFKPEWWKMLPFEVWQAIQAKPTDNFRWARGWDPAGGQSKGSDYSSGGLVGHARDGDKDKRIIIADITRGQWSPFIRNGMMVSTARADEKFAPSNLFWKSRTPDMNSSILEGTAEFGFWAITERGRKFQRAQRLAVQAEAGNVWLAPGIWNAAFMQEASQFKDEDSDDVRKDDQVDCVCLADSQLFKFN